MIEFLVFLGVGGVVVGGGVRSGGVVVRGGWVGVGPQGNKGGVPLSCIFVLILNASM